MAAHVIAVLWDFDKTLIHGYMQTPLFDHFQVESKRFWDEVNALPAFHSDPSDGEALVSESLYLNHILTYVRAGIFGGLSNDLLRQLGRNLSLAPGVPEIFDDLHRACRFTGSPAAVEVRLEHYVITTGLRQMVLGSRIGPHMRHVWGCEFLSKEAPPGFLENGITGTAGGTIDGIGYVIDSTTKTRAIFEINKGVRENLGIGVNTAIPQTHRRVPIENMIYVADGPSDIPSWSVVRQFGGKAFAVYEPRSEFDLAQAEQLLLQGRVDSIGPADFREGTMTHRWLCEALADTANRLAQSSPPSEIDQISPTPRHRYS